MTMLYGSTAVAGSNAVEEASRQRATMVSDRLMDQRRQRMDAAAEKRMDQSAKEFETVFLAAMLRPMMADTELPKPFGGGFSEEMYKGLLVDEYAKAITNHGGIGVAAHVKREMIALQEGQRAALTGGQHGE